MKKSRITAIITARGQSKGLPRKNIRMLLNKPLIAHTILAALNCPQVDRCIVSTEDSEIKSVSVEWGAEVFDRSSELAGDLSLSSDVVQDVLMKLKEEGDFPEYFVLLQPTSPLRNDMHLTECIEGFLKSEAACTMSVTETEHHPCKSFYLEDDKLVPLFGEENLNKPRQVLPKVYRQNGAIYMMSSELFMERNSFFVKPCIPYVMRPEDSIDIDTEMDLVICSKVLELQKGREKTI